MTLRKNKAIDSSLSSLQLALRSLTARQLVSRWDCDRMGGEVGGARLASLRSLLRLVAGLSSAHEGHAMDSPLRRYLAGKLAGSWTILLATRKAMRDESRFIVEKYDFLLNSRLQISLKFNFLYPFTDSSNSFKNLFLVYFFTSLLKVHLLTDLKSDIPILLRCSEISGKSPGSDFSTCALYTRLLMESFGRFHR